MDVGVPTEFRAGFASFSAPAPCCIRQPVETAMHLEATAPPAMIHTSRPRNVNLMAPWELKHGYNCTEAVLKAPDHYAKRQLAGHDVPLELLQDVIVEDCKADSLKVERWLLGNRVAAVERGDTTLLFHTTGEAGDVVSVTQLHQQHDREAGNHFDAASPPQVQATSLAECCIGRSIHQLTAWTPPTASPQQGAGEEPVWLAVCCMHIVFLLCATLEDTAKATWNLFMTAKAVLPSCCLHLAWNPALPELAIMQDDGTINVLWCGVVVLGQGTPGTWPWTNQQSPSLSATARNQRPGGPKSMGNRGKKSWGNRGGSAGMYSIAAHGCVELRARVVLERGEVPEFDLVVAGLACEYGVHPRTLVCAYGSTLMLVHIPPPRLSPVHAAPLPVPAPICLCKLQDGESICTIARPAGQTLFLDANAAALLAVATSSQLLLLDLRRPHQPLLTWAHRMQQDLPRLCALHLTMTSQGDAGAATGGATSQVEEFPESQCTTEPSAPSQINSFHDFMDMPPTQASQAAGYAGPAPAQSVKQPQPPPAGSILGIITCAGLLHGHHRCAEFTFVPPQNGFQVGSRPSTESGPTNSWTSSQPPRPFKLRLHHQSPQHTHDSTTTNPTPPSRAQQSSPVLGNIDTPSAGRWAAAPRYNAQEGGPDSWISIVPVGKARQGGFVGHDQGGQTVGEGQAGGISQMQVAGTAWLLQQCGQVTSTGPVNALCRPLHTFFALPLQQQVFQERLKLYVDMASRRRWHRVLWEPRFAAEALEELEEIRQLREEAPDCQGSVLIWLPPSFQWPAASHHSPPLLRPGPYLVRATVDGDLALQQCFWLNRLDVATMKRAVQPVGLQAKVAQPVAAARLGLSTGSYVRVCNRFWKDEWKRHETVSVLPKPLPEADLNQTMGVVRLPAHYAHVVRLLERDGGTTAAQGQERNSSRVHAGMNRQQVTWSASAPAVAVTGAASGTGAVTAAHKLTLAPDMDAVQRILGKWQQPGKAVSMLSSPPVSQQDTAQQPAHKRRRLHPPPTPPPEIQPTQSADLRQHTQSAMQIQQAQSAGLSQHTQPAVPCECTQSAVAIQHSQSAMPGQQTPLAQQAQSSLVDLQKAHSRLLAACKWAETHRPQLLLHHQKQRLQQATHPPPASPPTSGPQTGQQEKQEEQQQGTQQGIDEGQQHDTARGAQQPSWLRVAPIWHDLLLSLLITTRLSQEAEDAATEVDRQDPEMLQGEYYGTGPLPWKCPYCGRVLLHRTRHQHLQGTCEVFRRRLGTLATASSPSLTPLALELAAEGDIRSAATLVQQKAGGTNAQAHGHKGRSTRGTNDRCTNAQAPKRGAHQHRGKGEVQARGHWGRNVQAPDRRVHQQGGQGEIQR